MERTTAPLVVVAGPTGSGKSEIALRVAEEFGGEVVNCDSVQVYRHFHIGTAKVPESERRGIPHRLIDIAEPDEVFTAGDYSRVARKCLVEIAGRGRLPVVTGGTGFYLRALLEGLFAGPARDQALRERLAERERRRPGSLHRLLRRFDAASAARIHGNDTKKIMRAMEVILKAQRPLSEMLSEGRDALEGFRVLKLGLDPPRPALYGRLDERARQMYSEGLIEETRHILALGYPAGAKPFESLGYAQALEVIQGRMSVEEAIVETQLRTRRYAKRQWSWFRRESGMEWVRGFGDEEETQRQVIDRVRRFL